MHFDLNFKAYPTKQALESRWQGNPFQSPIKFLFMDIVIIIATKGTTLLETINVFTTL